MLQNHKHPRPQRGQGWRKGGNQITLPGFLQNNSFCNSFPCPDRGGAVFLNPGHPLIIITSSDHNKEKRLECRSAWWPGLLSRVHGYDEHPRSPTQNGQEPGGTPCMHPGAAPGCCRNGSGRRCTGCIRNNTGTDRCQYLFRDLAARCNDMA